ncbi:MAG: peptidase T [Crocinitomicaceae bacterium]|jgi:tripeptide aminopeptidase|nr:peptidase T [Crocinitomicaceae bacterium]MDG1742931.1 peptidase T [Crocinitomicaceae bacterium]
MNNYISTVESRFIKYAKIDTTADPNSTSFPSTEIQKDLGRELVRELLEMGVNDAEMDEWGYVYGTLPNNTENRDLPVICFCSHMDTAPDVTGKNVKPIVHRNYDGSPITLPDDTNQIITTEKHPYLKEKIGDDLITASGLTLLGADDKAGVAIIMDLVHHLTSNPEIKHPTIRILFTPDEEVGRGVDHLDMEKLNADYGYTLDGGILGSLEDESFSADGVKITVQGISAHPGYAKNKMVNAMKVVSEFIAALPKDSWSPETTSGREGFVHPHTFTGGMEESSVSFIIRDHDTAKLADYEERLENILKETLSNYPALNYQFEVTEQYRNMKEIIKNVPFVTEYAISAMEKAGVMALPAIIRGGTDGSRLSFMGLPCPNIFTGEMAIHSRHEYVSVQDMEKAVATLVELSQIWTNHK